MQRPDVEGFIRIAKSVSEDSEWISGRSVIALCNYILHLEREAAAVRNNALEEAAKRCDMYVHEIAARCCAKDIRALKTQETT